VPPFGCALVYRRGVVSAGALQRAINVMPVTGIQIAAPALFWAFPEFVDFLQNPLFQ